MLKVFALILVLSMQVLAQQKPTLKPADYGKFESLGAGLLSPDGKWLAYGITRTNGNNELRLRSISSDATVTAPFGVEPAFTDNARWLAYAIGFSELEEEKLRAAKKPVQRKLGLRNLQTGDTTTFDDVAAFSFSKTQEYLAMRRYAPERNSGESPAAGGDRETPGADLVVRDLAKGVNMTFGNVSSYAWQDGGTLLAMTINADGKSGNGIYLYDAASGVMKVLDSGAEFYNGITWRKKDDDLAVLRTKSNKDYADATQVVLVWQNLSTPNPVAKTLDLSTTDTRIVRYRAPAWSDSGEILFIGTQPWKKKVPADKLSALPEGEEFAAVDIWHAKDVRIIPEQKITADRDRQRNFLAAWHVADGKFVQLGTELTETVTAMKGDRFALGRDETPYEREAMFGRDASDLYLIDVKTGTANRVAQKVPYVQGVSAGGRYVLYFKDNHFWTVHAETGKTTNISVSVKTNFDDRDDDHPAEHRSSYGVAGWTKDDASVLVYDRNDVWELKSDGSGSRKLTSGAADEVRHRYVRLDPEEEFIDLAKPVYFSLYGQWTKKFGYGRLQPGSGNAERLVFLDKNVARLAKARSADVYAYVVQDFDDSPDYFAGSSLTEAKQVTDTNPFQKDYAWGKAELVEFKTPKGERLQGALYYPANYEPGKKYPMITYIYEIRSDQVHAFSAPSERSPYNSTVYTQRGYFFFQPDIVFKPRDPGASIVECVTAGVKKMVDSGMVDANRLGLFGHSWGGYGTAYLATNTNLFKAAVAGAPLTDFISMSGSVFWNSGTPETGHFEVGQERMQVPFYEDKDAYLRNSPLFNVEKLRTPLILEDGDKDGNVDWHQSINFYNHARRARKDLIFLVYADENHNLRVRKNQIDYHRRIVDWFAHYLEGAPAQSWMTNGVKYLDRQDEIQRAKDAKPKP